MAKKIKGKILSIQDNNIIVELSEQIDDIDKYEVLVQKKTKKRGLDANALSWALIDRLAIALKSSRDEIYDLMLQRYGVATYLVVKPNEADRILNLMEHGRILGNIEVGGKQGTQLQVFLGSSTYDRSEFSHYLNRNYYRV